MFESQLPLFDEDFRVITGIIPEDQVEYLDDDIAFQKNDSSTTNGRTLDLLQAVSQKDISSNCLRRPLPQPIVTMTNALFLINTNLAHPLISGTLEIVVEMLWRLMLGAASINWKRTISQ